VKEGTIVFCFGPWGSMLFRALWFKCCVRALWFKCCVRALWFKCCVRALWSHVVFGPCGSMCFLVPSFILLYTTALHHQPPTQPTTPRVRQPCVRSAGSAGWAGSAGAMPRAALTGTPKITLPCWYGVEKYRPVTGCRMDRRNDIIALGHAVPRHGLQCCLCRCLQCCLCRRSSWLSRGYPAAVPTEP